MKLFELAEQYFQNPEHSFQIANYQIFAMNPNIGFSASQKDGKEIHHNTRDLVTSVSHIRDNVQTNVLFNHGAPIRLKLVADKLREHCCDYYELRYVMAGTLYIEIEGRENCFRAGEICVINAMALRREMLDKSECLLLNIIIDKAIFTEAFLNSPGLNAVKRYLHQMIIERSEKQHFLRFTPLSEGYTEKLDEYLSAIFLEIIRELPGYTDISRGYLIRLIDFLTNNYQHEYGRKESKLYEEKLFESVREYLNAHLDTVCMEDLATNFHFQPNYFNNLVKKHTGMTYSQYLISLRIEHAKRLLYSTDLSIEEIMRLVGYNNKGFFYKKFQESVGMSPKAFRKKHLP